jgi:hypothetical protein
MLSIIGTEGVHRVSALLVLSCDCHVSLSETLAQHRYSLPQPFCSNSRLNTRGDSEAVHTCASQAIRFHWHGITQARVQRDIFYYLPSWSLPVRGRIPTPRSCQGSTMVVEKATNPHACIRPGQSLIRPMLQSPPRWDSCREAQTTIGGSTLLRTGYKNRFFTACEGEDHLHTYTTHQRTPTHLISTPPHYQKWPATPLPASAPPAPANLAAASALLATPRYTRKVCMSFSGRS